MIRDRSSQDEIIEPVRGWTRDRIIAVTVALLVFAGAALAFPTWRHWASAEQTVSLDQVRFGRVTRGTLTSDISAVGKVVTAIKPTLFSPAASVVTLRLRAGHSVKKGRLIAKIDSPDLRRRFLQETAALNAAVHLHRPGRCRPSDVATESAAKSTCNRRSGGYDYAMQNLTSKRFIDPAGAVDTIGVRYFWLGYYYFVTG